MIYGVIRDPDPAKPTLAGFIGVSIGGGGGGAGTRSYRYFKFNLGSTSN